MTDFERKLREESEKEKNKFDKVKDKDLGINEENIKDYSFISDIVIFITSSLLMLGVLGFLEVINANFDWSAYLSVNFWIEYIILQATSWSARIILRNLGDRKEYRNNKDYKMLQLKMQNFVEEDSKKPFIERYSEIDDKFRKLTAFKNKQKRKLIKLSNKYRITNIVSYVYTLENNDTGDLNLFEMKSDIIHTNKWKQRRWSKKQLKVNAKMNNILNTLTKNWISQNLDTVKVKYNKVSRTILVSGFYSKENQYLGEDYKDNSTTEFMKMTIPTTVFAMAFMFLIIPLKDSSLSTDWEAWFKLIIKTFIVFFSGLMMWLNNPDLFRRTKQKALSERVNRLNIYSKEEQSRNNQ